MTSMAILGWLSLKIAIKVEIQAKDTVGKQPILILPVSTPLIGEFFFYDFLVVDQLSD